MRDLEDVFRRQILPLLQEYFFEDWENIALVLNDPNKPAAQRFLRQPDADLERLFGRALVRSTNPRWELQSQAFADPASYISIYEVARGL
jgi:5-methylcytosine-specific restriction protein B